MQLETGLGKAVAIKQIEVTWQGPNAKQVFTDVPMNGFVKLTEGQPDFEIMTTHTYKFQTMPADSMMMHHHM